MAFMKQWGCFNCGNKKLRKSTTLNMWNCETWDCMSSWGSNDIKTLTMSVPPIKKGYQQYQDLTKNEKSLEEEIQDLLKDDLYPWTPIDPKCECGGASIGQNMHSAWCPAYKK